MGQPIRHRAMECGHSYNTEERRKRSEYISPNVRNRFVQFVHSIFRIRQKRIPHTSVCDIKYKTVFVFRFLSSLRSSRALKLLKLCQEMGKRFWKRWSPKSSPCSNRRLVRCSELWMRPKMPPCHMTKLYAMKHSRIMIQKRCSNRTIQQQRSHRKSSTIDPLIHLT